MSENRSLVPSISPPMASEQNTTTSKPEPKNKPPLLNLPLELHRLIFKKLHKVDSVCLGLSSRVLYQIHWRTHGRVRLSTLLPVRREVYIGGDGMYRQLWCLGQLLENWMGPEWELAVGYRIFRRVEEWGLEE